jgi:hypothetical protein
LSKWAKEQRTEPGTTLPPFPVPYRVPLHQETAASGSYAAIASSNCGPLFRGEPTRRSTGQVRSNPSAAGRSGAA